MGRGHGVTQSYQDSLGGNGQAFLPGLAQSLKVGQPGKSVVLGRDFLAGEGVPEGCLLIELPAAGPLTTCLLGEHEFIPVSTTTTGIRMY